jgi:pimeloyl-ACP methyl ester carboxylesterase
MWKKRLAGQAWKVGLGAGVVGAVIMALKYAVRKPVPLRMSGAISPPVFVTKVLHTSLGEVVFHESGSGPLLVFVHDVACGASSYEWSKVYERFGDEHRVIALDLVGFGESSRPQRVFRPSDYVQMLAEFLRANEPGAVLVASGLSAAFCTELAGAQPGLVSRLVLYRPTGTWGAEQQPPGWLTRQAFRWGLLGRFLYRNHLATRNALSSWLRRHAFSRPEAVPEECIEVYTDCSRQPGAEHAVMSWLAGRLRLDFEASLLRCSCPVHTLGNGRPLEALEFPDRIEKGIRTALVASESGGGMEGLKIVTRDGLD